MTPDEAKKLGAKEKMDLGIAANIAAIKFFLAMGDITGSHVVSIPSSALPYTVSSKSNQFYVVLDYFRLQGWAITVTDGYIEYVYTLEFAPYA
jgi:hypothetical protein